MRVDVADINFKNYSRLVVGGYGPNGRVISYDPYPEPNLFSFSYEFGTTPDYPYELLAFNTQLDELNNKMNLISVLKGYGLYKLGAIVVKFSGAIYPIGESTEVINSGYMIKFFIPNFIYYPDDGQYYDPGWGKFPSDLMLTKDEEYPNGLCSIFILNKYNEVALELSVENENTWQDKLKKIKSNYIPSLNEDVINSRSIVETNFKRTVTVIMSTSENLAKSTEMTNHKSINYFEHDGLVAKSWLDLRPNTTPSSILTEMIYTGNKLNTLYGNLVCADYTKYFLGSPISVENIQ